MPPQQTNLTSEPGRDAAGLRFGFAIVSVKDAATDTLVAARPHASVGALKGALSEKEAAGPQAASTRSVLRSLKGCWQALQKRRQRNRLRVSVHDMSDRQLMDIGLAAGDIDYIAAHRAFDRLKDGTTYPWLSRGVI